MAWLGEKIPACQLKYMAGGQIGQEYGFSGIQLQLIRTVLSQFLKLFRKPCEHVAFSFKCSLLYYGNDLLIRLNGRRVCQSPDTGKQTSKTCSSFILTVAYRQWIGSRKDKECLKAELDVILANTWFQPRVCQDKKGGGGEEHSGGAICSRKLVGGRRIMDLSQLLMATTCLSSISVKKVIQCWNPSSCTLH